MWGTLTASTHHKIQLYILRTNWNHALIIYPWFSMQNYRLAQAKLAKESTNHQAQKFKRVSFTLLSFPFVIRTAIRTFGFHSSKPFLDCGGTWCSRRLDYLCSVVMVSSESSSNQRLSRIWHKPNWGCKRNHFQLRGFSNWRKINSIVHSLQQMKCPSHWFYMRLL